MTFYDRIVTLELPPLEAEALEIFHRQSGFGEAIVRAALIAKEADAIIAEQAAKIERLRDAILDARNTMSDADLILRKATGE